MRITVYKKYPVVVLAATIFILILFMFVKDMIVINISPSIPLGIYSLKPTNMPLKHNDLVAVCLNKHEQDFALSRGYLHAGTRCNGSTLLLKSILAIPNDNVTLTDNQIIVNDKVYNYLTQQYDSKHRLLPSWPRGIYKNTNGYWAIGTNSINSWDSRYFGTIDRNQIIFLLKPLWIWS